MSCGLNICYCQSNSIIYNIYNILYCFNTSHVTLYRSETSWHCMWMICFNTSHVTLYQICTISLRLLQLRFNTSHVTLYPDPPTRVTHNKKFQYISCYSLSSRYNYPSIHQCGFQYISCYSLSLLIMWFGIDELSFNTSHVTLYRKISIKGYWQGRVSIHLMLLFINLNIRKEPDKNRFQYISCYSLSAVRCRLNSPLLFQYISCYSLS